MPSEVSIDMTDDNITHTWSHPNPELVQHYKIVLEGEDPAIQINSTSVVIARVPGLSYSGSLSAVSICQRESEARSFEGMSCSWVSMIMSHLMLSFSYCFLHSKCAHVFKCHCCMSTIECPHTWWCQPCWCFKECSFIGFHYIINFQFHSNRCSLCAISSQIMFMQVHDDHPNNSQVGRASGVWYE